MKGLNVLMAFLGGAALGVGAGIMFAPYKGKRLAKRFAKH